MLVRASLSVLNLLLDHLTAPCLNHRQILNGLFTITGIGLIPWRVRDSYHMSVIASHFQKRRRSESPASSRKDPSTSQAESQGSSQETPLLFDRCLVCSNESAAGEASTGADTQVLGSLLREPEMVSAVRDRDAQCFPSQSCGWRLCSERPQQHFSDLPLHCHVGLGLARETSGKTKAFETRIRKSLIDVFSGLLLY